MTTWTGGQYSAVRALLGAVVLPFGFLVPADGPLGSALTAISTGLFSLFLMIGAYDRLAAGFLLVNLAAAYPGRILSDPGAFATMATLGTHLFVPPAPYGSWAARGRTDPAGGWTMPQAVQAGVRLVAILL